MSYIDEARRTIYLTEEDWKKIEELENLPIDEKALQQFIEDTNTNEE